ncbi:MAG: flagellar hook assembly protein FlgD [Rhodomicrobium sp.]|nr:flagellar hook assembly protein FlgD [Rhodomicrobium sp.]
MDVTSIASTGAQAGSARGTETGRKNTLDYDTFLTLLVAQLKFQDPTEPRDSAEYIAQLASFSQVEQAIVTNTKLDQLMASLAFSQADGVIGRTVTSADGALSGKAVAVQLVSDGAIALLEDGSQVPLIDGVVIS